MITKEVKEYLEKDRCWAREHRIAHARYQLKKSNNPTDSAFWQAVLDANLQCTSND